MSTVAVKPAHVARIAAGHPWVYATAVDRIYGGAMAGDRVTVVDTRDNFLGVGWYSPQSDVVVRILSRDPTTKLDSAWLLHRLSQAHQTRHEMGLPTATTNGYRLVNSEGDGLGGLTVDRFNNVATVQLATLGMQQRKAIVIDSIRTVFGVQCIVEQTHRHDAQAEGFEWNQGVLWGQEQAAHFRFDERGIAYDIPMELVSSTGFCFDRRALRARVEQLSRGRRVLDGFCYVGSLAMNAARGGAASVVAIDDNLLALQTAARCAQANSLSSRIRFHRASIRQLLDKDEHVGKYDMVLLDPPMIFSSRRVANARIMTETTDRPLREPDNENKAMQRMMLQGCRLVRPGGLIVICSGEPGLRPQDLSEQLAAASARSHRSAIVMERWFQGADHPYISTFSEGLQFQSIIARIETR